FEGQTGVESYEYRQRHPNDYEAQVSQGLINSHAAENLGVTDAGLIQLRRQLRKGIRTVQEGGDPSPLTRVGDEWMTHVQDTVLPIPPKDDMDDKQLMKEVTDAVMAVVFDGDRYSGKERIDYIQTELKKIRQDPRFTG
ncbi:MAG: aromatic ring-hydroxylating dioxygenase subunit alpha, partial [Gammaproteobacteria bacterium]|nr:aromatic ring-hydroxylating dioxygenase subunit alpha [Gammaproteobacteria bacterium]